MSLKHSLKGISGKYEVFIIGDMRALRGSLVNMPLNLNTLEFLHNTAYSPLRCSTDGLVHLPTHHNTAATDYKSEAHSLLSGTLKSLDDESVKGKHAAFLLHNWASFSLQIIRWRHHLQATAILWGHSYPYHLQEEYWTTNKIRQHLEVIQKKNPAYGRQRISRPMRIVAPH